MGDNNMPETTTPVAVSGTPEGTAVPKEHNQTLMGVLAYCGILVLIPYFMAKDDKFVYFHIKQGLLLCVGWVALWFLSTMMIYMLYQVISILQLVLVVFSIIGIVKVVQKKEEPLPLIGKFAEHINI